MHTLTLRLFDLDEALIKENALILLFVDLVRGSQRVIHYVDQVCY